MNEKVYRSGNSAEKVCKISKKLPIGTFCMILLALFIGAYGMKIYHDIQFLDCHDFTTKHTIWKGFLAKDSTGDVRCFWLEQAHPNRIRQGVPVNAD